MPKIVVIAEPEMLPVELADNPDVVIVSPSMVGEDIIAALDDASGGLLGGAGELTEWAKEEEAEPAHSGSGDDEEEPSGEGDDDLPSGEGDDEEPSGEGYGDDDLPAGEGDDEEEPSGSGRGRRSGRGDDEEERVGGSGRGRRGGRGRGRGDDEERVGGSGRGRSPLAAWVASQTGGGRR